MVVKVSTKRRKLSHSSASGDDEEASFASFSESENSSDEQITGKHNVEDDSIERRKPTKKPTSSRRQDVDFKGVDASTALAGGSSHSSLFRLQIGELLEEIKVVPGKTERAAESMLHKIKAAIEQIPERKPLPVDEAERELITKKKVAVPFPNPRPPRSAQYKLAYTKPESINVVGSYALRSITSSIMVLSIDMIVTMPSSLFEQKDYLNHRYFYKRAYYLACIAAGLQKHLAEDTQVCFDQCPLDTLRPVLVIRPKSGAKSDHKSRSWRINIIPCIAASVFQAEKLYPTKNNIRDAQQANGEVAATPTPFYNSAIQTDTLYIAYLKLLHKSAASCPAFTDACWLGRVWLTQRGHVSSIAAGGFGHFEFSALMALLLQYGAPNGGPALAAGYTSYQLFKVTLQYLSAKDLTKPGIFLDVHGPTDALRASEDLPTIFDGPRKHNLLFKMTPWSYQKLRANASTTIKMLSVPGPDTFDQTFISKVSTYHLQYDCTFTIPMSALDSLSLLDHTIVSRAGKLYTILKRGLGDRIQQLSVRETDPEEWRTDSARPQQKLSGLYHVSIVFDQVNVSRAVDHGPAAEDKKAAADFRNFWGPKAELRRFKDGSILESLVWSKGSAASMVEQIVRHLLARHFSDTVAQAAIFASAGPAQSTKIDYTATADSALQAYRTLESDIRAMDALPLSVRQISASDPQLRSTSLLVANGTKIPADVVIQFESSGRWPDDLQAIQRVKIAFLLKLAESFESTKPDMTCRLGLEKTDSLDIVNQAFLDITYPSSSMTFRVRIHHDREQTLLENMLKDKASAPASREAAALGLAEYKRVFLHSPAHTLIVQKLCTQYPTLSASILMTKQWFASHLLGKDFCDELIELMVLRTYTRPWPWSTPSSAKTAFLRTLDFLSHWDWREDPLIVDLGDGVEKKPGGSMRTRFEAYRKVDPAMNRMALFVASSLDADGTAWTSGTHGPSKVLAGRMTALAKAASETVLSKGLELDFEELFVSSLEDYDFAIHIEPDFVAGLKSRQGRTSNKYKNLVVEGSLHHKADDEIVGLFVNELKGLYSQTLIFLYGGSGCSVIGALWNPFVVARPWKVNLPYSTRPLLSDKVDDDEGDNSPTQGVLAEVNREDILGEIARLGGDMIKRIDVKNA